MLRSIDSLLTHYQLLVQSNSYSFANSKLYLDFTLLMTSMPINSSVEIRELILCKRYYFSADEELQSDSATSKHYHRLIDPLIDDNSYVIHPLVDASGGGRVENSRSTGSSASHDCCPVCERDLDPHWHTSRRIYPLSYSIPDELILSAVPVKEHLWAEVIPGQSLTYRFEYWQEEDYKTMYQSSMFGFTRKKSGWDALRHYELLANAVLPVFQDLRDCPPSSLTSFPKNLVLAAMHELLPWNSSATSQLRYVYYVEKLLTHTRDHCSTSAAARYFLSRFESPGEGKPVRNILLLTGHSEVNYSRETLWIGLKRYIDSIGTPNFGDGRPPF